MRAETAAVAAAADNYRLAYARYQGGIDSFLASLDAQRSLYAAQRSLVATRLTKATNAVTLYRVLGGDSQLDATAEPQPAGDAPPLTFTSGLSNCQSSRT